MLSSLSNLIWNAWLSVPYRWRRRIVVTASVWAAVHIFVAVYGFGLLLLALLAAFALAFGLAELGMRKADIAETWFYGALTGQLRGIVTGALMPVMLELWLKWNGSRVRDDLIVAIIVAALFAYTFLLMRKTISGALESGVKARRRARALN